MRGGGLHLNPHPVSAPGHGCVNGGGCPLCTISMRVSVLISGSLSNEIRRSNSIPHSSTTTSRLGPHTTYGC